MAGIDDRVDELLPLIQRAERSGDQAVSPKGAIGRYQIMPATARALGFDPAQLTNVDYNTNAARAVIKDLIRQHGENDTKAIVAGYNASPAAVNKWKASGRDDSVLPLETQKYVRSIGLAQEQPAKSWQDRVNQARAAGFSWDEINAQAAQRRSTALAAGFSEAEIDAALGFKSPEPMENSMQMRAASAAPPPPAGDQSLVATNLLEAMVAGAQSSSIDQIWLNGKLPDFVMPKDAGRAMRIAAGAFEVIGDIPLMLGAALASAPAGPIAMGAAAFAAPASVKAEYADAAKNGRIKSAADFATRKAGVLWKTAEAASVGALTVASGGAAGAAAEAAGAGAATTFLTAKSAELGAMTAVSSGLEGQLPTLDSVVDNAILLAGAHVAFAAPGMVKPIQDKLVDHWYKTGEKPADAVKRAETDLALKQKLQTPPDPPQPITASVTDGTLVIPRAPKDSGLHVRDEVALEDRAPLTPEQSEKIGELRTGAETAMKRIGIETPKLDDPWEALEQAYDADPGERPIAERIAAAYQSSYDGIIENKTYTPAADKPLPEYELLDQLEGIERASLDETALEKAVRYMLRKPQGSTAGSALRDRIETELFPDHTRPANAMEDMPLAQRIRRLRGQLPKLVVLPENTGTGLSKPPIASIPEVTQWDHIEQAVKQQQGSNFAISEAVTAISKYAKEAAKQDATRTEIERGQAPIPSDPWEAVGSRIAEPAAAPTVMERISNTAYQAYLDLMGPEHPLRMLTDAASKGKPLPDIRNPLFLNRLASLSSGRASAFLETYRGILKQFPGAKEAQRFRTYQVARWSVEKYGQNKETGVDLSSARDVIREGEGKYEEAFKAVVELQNASLRDLQDSGVISRAEFDAMVADNRARIPGYRENAQPRATGGKGGSGGVVRDPIKEFVGSKRKIKPIEESIMRDVFLRKILADRNRANDAALQAGEETGLAVVREAANVKVTSEVLSKLTEADAGVEEAFAEIAGKHLQTDEVPVFRNGKMLKVVFSDPNLTKFLRGADRRDLSMWGKMMQATTKVTKGLITLNPVFPVKMLQYDIPWQFITKPGFRNTLADAYRGIFEVMTNGKAYNAAIQEGIVRRAFEPVSQDAYIRDVMRGQGDPAFADGVWNAIKTPYHALEVWSHGLAAALPVGRFARGAKGESATKAIVEATEARFPPHNYGGPGARMLNAVQPFTTAYLAGLEKTFQAFTGRELTGEKIHSLKTIAQNAAKAVAVITVPVLMNWYESKDTKWYKAAPYWQKDNGLLFHWGPDDGNGTTVFVKFPPIISFIFGGMPRRIMEATFEHDPHAFDHMGASAALSLAPPGGLLTYNVLTPLIEHMANHSFSRDAALVPDGLRNTVLAPEQASPFSSVFSKNASRFLSDFTGQQVAPQVLDNYLAGWGGSLGDAAVKYSEMALGANPNLPPARWSDLPLFNSYTTRYPSANAQPITDFRARIDHLQQVHGSLVKLFKTGDLARFQQLARENPIAAMFGRYNLRGVAVPDDVRGFTDALAQAHIDLNPRMLQKLKAADITLERHREYATNIYAAAKDPHTQKKITPRDKQQILDKTYMSMQAIAEQGMKDLDEAGVR